MTSTVADAELPQGLRRVRTLWRLFRNERDDPEPFYTMLAGEAAADLDRRHGPLAGQRIADLGCGPGHYTAALRARGAAVVPVEGDIDELHLAGPPPPGALLGDAGRLPFPDASLDGLFCSNLLEHARDTAAVIAELGRVLRPGGWGYLSWTNWYSPWGGHDMAPYQFLGPRLGPRLYERRHGPPRKNRFGEALFAVHIGPTLRLFAAQPGLVVDRVEPRYWPWAAPVTRVPGLREVLTWNCVIRFHSHSFWRPDGPHMGHLDARTDGGAGFEAALARARDVEGWLTDAQARRLWDRAGAVGPSATIVEIGSFRGRSAIVLAKAAPAGADVVAIDPHAGNDRGPGQWDGTVEEGQSDHEAFVANLARAGVSDRVRHVRRFSGEAHGDVEGAIDLLYVDGAHGYGPARADLQSWGARVAPGGTLLVHDAYSAVGVTMAQVRCMFLSGSWRYQGRSGSMAEYRRVPLRGRARLANVARQSAALPWFARNLVIKVLIVARLRPLTRALRHRQDSFPY